MSEYVTKSNVLSALGRFKENADNLYATNAEVTDVKNALEDSEQRIENLEQAVSGSLVQTNVLTDPPSMANVRTITSANTILPWALLNRVGARATAWNQLINRWRVIGSGTTSDSSVALTLSNNGVIDEPQNISIRGHVYLVILQAKKSADFSGTVKVIRYIRDSGGTDITSQLNTDYKWFYFWETATKNNDTINIELSSWSAGSASFVNLMLFDLTTMNEASLTADQFRAKFPATYYPYNAGGIIPLNPSAFKVVGWNQFNEVWADGQAINPNNGTTGGTTSYSTTDWIKVIAGQTYYIRCDVSDSSAAGWGMCYYDANKQFVAGYVHQVTSNFINRERTIPAGTVYIRFTVGNSYKAGVNVNISQTDTTRPLHNGVYAPYHEQIVDTSFTSDYKYVNPSCHDYSENVLVDGQKRREEHIVVGSYTFTGSETWSAVGYGYRANIDDISAVVLPDSSTIPNASHSKLQVTATLGTTSSSGLMTISISGSYVYIGGGAYSDLANSINGTTIYYELATPNAPTLHDPIPNFPSEDGTTITAITPQTDLVNAIDVPNTIAYMTKISS